MGMKGLKFKNIAASSWDYFAVLISDGVVLLTLFYSIRKVDTALQSHLEA